MPNYELVKFKDVPVGGDFGHGDYYYFKVNETKAVMEVSNEIHEWDPEIEVVIEVD